jgi:hypothetical protein
MNLTTRFVTNTRDSYGYHCCFCLTIHQIHDQIQCDFINLIWHETENFRVPNNPIIPFIEGDEMMFCYIGVE